MIKDNRIIFGYGTIECGNGVMTLVYTEIKPPQKIGFNTYNSEDVEYGNQICLQVTMKELNDLLYELKDIENTKEIFFKGYIFDFNNYNENSVSIVKTQIQRVMNISLLPYAC